MQYLNDLNPAQKEAVLSTEGPVMVLAGAGAGKTKTITSRILHLIHSGIDPREILAVTFTNKAAKEMRERVFTLVGKEESRVHLTREAPFVSTFHALGVYILRAHANFLGLPKHFGIFDRDDSVRLVREAITAAGLDPKQFEPRKILSAISSQKGDGVTLRDYREDAKSYFPSIVASVWERYEGLLKGERALDFDDLLSGTVKLLRDHPEILKSYQDRWRYIHVDEYQDTNKIQHELTQLLASPRHNLCVVGDIDQTIYTWRGAQIEHLLAFETEYPNAKTILLEENYRSTKTIIAVSNSIIERNTKRKEKHVFTNNADGEAVSLFAATDEAEEGKFIALTAQELIKNGVSPKEIAVLYRANFQSRALEEAFLRYGVPYQVLGVRFFERKEVKDALSFLRAALNPESISDLKRVINVPPRGIGKVTLLKIAAGKMSELPPATLAKVRAFRALLDEIAAAARSKIASETIKFLIERTGLSTDLAQKGEEGAERLENLKELVTLAKRYDALPPEDAILALLEDAALATDQDELADKKEKVALMTVHASKGLEFDYIFISGLEEGLFPHERMGEEVDDEEERRLFYVALTRARKKVYLTHASYRTIFGSRNVQIPSEFLSDIDEVHLAHEEGKEPTIE